MTNHQASANDPQKPHAPVTPTSAPQQNQGDAKPGTQKPAEQQK
jgi:hypothetical protein